jgi:hypothetical protein
MPNSIFWPIAGSSAGNAEFQAIKETIKITDAQMKSILTTPVELVPGIGGLWICVLAVHVRMDCTVFGTAVNGTVRYAVVNQICWGPATLVSTTGKRFNAASLSQFNIQTATELLGRSIEMVGSANAGASFATVDGTHVEITYVLL